MTQPLAEVFTIEDSVADLREVPGVPSSASPLFWVKKKKSQKEEKPAG